MEKSSLVSLHGCSLVTRTVPAATESVRVSLERFTGDRCTGDIAVGDGNRQVAVAIGDQVTVRRLDGSGKARVLDGGPVTDLRMSGVGGTVAGLDGCIG